MLVLPEPCQTEPRDEAAVESVLMIRLHLPLAKALLTQGVQVTSIGTPAKATVANREDEVCFVKGLRHVPWIWNGSPLRNGFRAIPIMARLIREVNPTVIHVNAVSDLVPVAVAISAAHLGMKRPIVVAMSRNPPVWASHRKAWMRAKIVQYFAGGFVALANSHRRQLLDLGLPSEMLTCIPNPYDEVLAYLGEQEKQKDGSSFQQKSRITYVAALRRRKAQDILIQAAALVLKAHPNVTFNLIGSAWPGEEAYEEKLRYRIDRLQLRDHVHLLGGMPHPEVVTSLLDTNIVVFPTLAEMMPRAVIEAMILGKPVVASAVDGILDLVQDRKTGLLVKPGDVDGLARAISELIENPALAAELAASGQNYVREFCSPERVGRLFCEFYAQCMHACA